MNRKTFTFASCTFASRPVRVAVAMKIAFIIIAANVSLAGAKVLWSKGQETPIATPAAAAVATVAPAAIAQSEPAKEVCRQVEVETDEGYGVRGHVTRWVCRTAL